MTSDDTFPPLTITPCAMNFILRLRQLQTWRRALMAILSLRGHNLGRNVKESLWWVEMKPWRKTWLIHFMILS